MKSHFVEMPLQIPIIIIIIIIIISSFHAEYVASCAYWF